MDKIYLQGTSLALNKNQVISFLPDSFGKTIQDKINYIKSKLGYSPVIRAYSIAHEGIARPTTPGENKKSVELKFTEKALDWIKEKATKAIEKGLRFFDGHNPTNDTQTNKELGQVIGVKKINHNGKKHVIAIGVFKEDAPSRDISSMEFSMDVEKLNSGSDEALDEITGIALADSSAGDKPGFPEAKQIAEFQCFEFQEIEDQKEIKIENKIKKETKKNMTLDEIKAGIKELGLLPQQLFSPTEVIGEMRVTDGKVEFDGGVPQFNNKIIARLKGAYVFPEMEYKQLQEKLNKLPELEKNVTEYKQFKVKQTISEQLPNIFKSKGFDETKQKYATEILTKKKILDNLDINVDAISQINAKLDEIAEDYEYNHKIFANPEIPKNVPAISGTQGFPGQSDFDY